MSLADWQAQLSQALLAPDAPEYCDFPALQGIEGRRLALYGELISNTVQDTLQSIYPHTYRLLSGHGKEESAWQALAERFRRERPNVSHKLMGAVSSFPACLGEQSALLKRFPFLPELALYEWLEMEVLNLPDIEPDAGLAPEVPTVEHFSGFAPAWNPARKLQSFTYNIPSLLTALQETDDGMEAVAVAPEPVEILIYREHETLQVRFFCLNELTARLLHLSSRGASYEQALRDLCTAIPALEAVTIEAIRAQAAQLFQNCLEKGMLLGSMPV